MMKCVVCFWVALCASLLSLSAQVNTNRMMQVGRNALYFEDYVLSIQYFNRVINVKPYLADPYYYRAIAKYYLDDLVGCQADCDVALNINPFLVAAYNLRGISKLRQHLSDEAREDFLAGLKYEPENLNLLMNAGVASINLKDYDDAIARYDDLLKIDKKNVSAILYRGIAIVEKGDTLSAISEFERALSINAYSADAITYLGMINFQRADYKKALSFYDKLVELRPLDSYAFVNRAIAKYNLDDLRGCAADLDEALRLDPKNLMALQNRGVLRVEAGDLNNAVDDFTRILSIDPSDDIALMNRATIYVQLGSAGKAMQDLNIIIAKHPDFGPAYAQRATVKRMAGDLKGAEADYLTAMTFERERVKRGLEAGANADSEPEKTDEDNDRHSGRKARGKKDADLAKYDRMVVVADFDDHDDKLSTDNQDKIRGRVQDRDIVIDLEPAFALTFFAADTLLPNARYFNRTVEAFNAKAVAPLPLLVSNRDVASNDVSAKVFAHIADVDKLLDAQPSETNLYFVRGTLNSVVMNYNNAISDFSVVLLKEPNNVNALFSRASARYKMVETIRSLDSDQLSPDNEFMGGSLPVRVDVTVLDYELILKDLERVVELDPDNEFAYYNMSLVLCQRRQFDAAIDMLNKAIDLNPQFAEAFFNRGIIRVFQGNQSDGIADLSKSGELGMFKAYNVIKRQSVDK